MLSHEVGAIIWYLILAVAWCVYLVQESFIVGSGMLQRLGRGEAKQRSIQLSGGLHYDGIEVWLITAVGGTFAAFPSVFATVLQSLYVPFFLLIVAIIVRVASIELMYKDESPAWRKGMSVAWGVSSFLIPLVLGVYFANMFRGLALDAGGYQGGIFGLFDIIGLSGGIFLVANALVAGKGWIKLTTVPDKDEGLASSVPLVAACVQAVALIALFLGLNNRSALFTGGPFAAIPALWALPVLAVLLALGTVVLAFKGKTVLQFVGSMATLLVTMASLFAAAFPRMVISSLDPAYGIDAFKGAASDLTLTVMTIAAAIFVPLVIAYQAWKYIRFRKDKNED